MVTIKQRASVEKLVETRGNVSRAMILGGYDPTSAKNPKNLTNSKGYKELLKQQLPTSLLFRKHRALLEKEDMRSEIDEKTGKTSLIPTGQPETQAVSKALDMAYKLKGMYPKDGVTAIQINFGQERKEYSN